MCGIVGYVGAQIAEPILVDGLRRLEYRGYDSAGIATLGGGTLHVRKRAGRISDLEKLLSENPSPGNVGISHTRWATHGEASDTNAHPHVAGDGLIAVVHNGVIENYAQLRDSLIEKGYDFISNTDTEVIAQLIYRYLNELGADSRNGDFKNTLILAVAKALSRLKGTYGLAVVSPRAPEMLLAARLGSPLIVGVGDEEHFVASDASALVRHTDRVIYLNDGELATVTADSILIEHRDTGPVEPSVSEIEWSVEESEKGEFEHYMLKEIFEQPQAIENALRGRLDEDNGTAHFGGLNLTNQQLRSVNRILLTACGTSWHAALVGEYLIEEYARIPVEVEYASELRYRNPPQEHGTVVFCIAQSGETADTLAALRESKRKGLPTLAIVNVVGSTIAREAEGGIYLHAGPEIGVASTKAFTSQLVVLNLLALYLGRMRHLSSVAGCRIIEHLRSLPDLIRETLQTSDSVRELAEKYCEASNFLYLGRNYNFPIALEGALKLKEVSYIHAEGYPAAEMKHGPIALVDEHTPSVIINPRGVLYDKVMSNLEEIKARGGPVIAVATEGDRSIDRIADDVITIPKADESLQSILSVIPLQLLAYHIAILRGCDVDKPRNLAKSVTVE